MTQNLNPILFYSIKQIYSPKFSKRSKYFCEALKKFFERINKSLKMEDIILSIKNKMNQNEEGQIPKEEKKDEKLHRRKKRRTAHRTHRLW